MNTRIEMRNLLLKIGIAFGLALPASLASSQVSNETAARHISKKFQALAMIARQGAVDRGFSAFKQAAYKEPFEHGVYIVNGDTPILNDQELREFYDREISDEWKSAKFGVSLSSSFGSDWLIVDAPNGTPNFWDNANKKNLSYCVSQAFGADHARVVTAMREAALAWEQVSDVKFVYLNAHDGGCSPATPQVVFDVRPVDVGGQYLARAFFPRTPRPQRNVLIDKSGLSLAPGKLTLHGILRHELGHVLSYRHEHTRAEAGKCFEDKDYKPLTSYDNLSVMHYPQCNGMGDWSLILSEKDKFGAACLYGQGPGYAVDPALCRKL